MRTIFVLGAPSELGGAGTELWHTLRMWRDGGIPITLVPTTPISPQWRDRVIQIGCQLHSTTPSLWEFLRDFEPTITSDGTPHPTIDQMSANSRNIIETQNDRRTASCVEFILQQIPQISYSTVISFCNQHFLRVAPALRQLGCHFVWVNCMNWLFRQERVFYERCGIFDHFVFQSLYQARELVPQLQPYGIQPSQTSIIRGAFCLDEFPFKPSEHLPQSPFVVGRISRPDPTKYPANFWKIIQSAPFSPIQTRVLGWNELVQKKLGTPPKNAEVLAPKSVTSYDFLRSLHVAVQLGGGARENWPRIGLEAMATGVPVIAPDAWGWREMLKHETTGLLVRNDQDTAYWIARLARDESFRMQLIHHARTRLEETFARPQPFLDAWKRVFQTC